MNFQEKIKALQRSHKHYLNSKPDEVYAYRLIKFSSKSPTTFSKLNSSQEDRYYVVDLNDLIGEGFFGYVYKAYLVKTDGELDTDNCFVAKETKYILSTKKYIKSLKEEANFNSFYYPTEALAVIKNAHKEKIGIIISKYHPGDTLDKMIPDSQCGPTANEDERPEDNTDKIISGKKLYSVPPENPKILLESLSIVERFNLICEIAMAINLFHHNTPASGPALYLQDLKEQNIIVQFVKREDEKKHKINVFPIDLNFANKVWGLDQVSIDPRGTKRYSPPETWFEQGGIKSDIYALVPIFATILNATNVYEYKNKQEEKNGVNLEYYQTQFNLTNLFNNLQIRPQLAKYTHLFLDRMQANDYNQRPDTDELLKFFCTLNNLVLIDDKKLTRKNTLSNKADHHSKKEIVEMEEDGQGDFNGLDSKNDLVKDMAEGDIAKPNHPSEENVIDEVSDFLLAQIKIIAHGAWYAKVGNHTFANYDFQLDEYQLVSFINAIEGTTAAFNNTLSEKLKTLPKFNAEILQQNNEMRKILKEMIVSANHYNHKKMGHFFQDRRLSLFKRTLAQAFIEEITNLVCKIDDKDNSSSLLVSILATDYLQRLRALKASIKDMASSNKSIYQDWNLNNLFQLKNIFAHIIRGSKHDLYPVTLSDVSELQIELSLEKALQAAVKTTSINTLNYSSRPALFHRFDKLTTKLDALLGTKSKLKT